MPHNTVTPTRANLVPGSRLWHLWHLPHASVANHMHAARRVDPTTVAPVSSEWLTEQWVRESRR